MNAASSHVIGSSIYASGEVSPGETSCNVLLMAPVGQGNLTIGYNKSPGSRQQLPSWMNESVTAPIHLKVTDPANQTLLEQDIVTPGTFPIEFKTRGQYNVYITNNGKMAITIPIGTTFEMGNPQNREADKYLLSLLLIAAGAVCTVVGLTVNLVSKRLVNKASSKSSKKQNGV